MTASPQPLELNPATVVAEGPLWILALNANQNLLGKTMLVLRRPCTSVAALDESEWADARHWIRRTCAALDALFRPDLYNHCFLMNMDRQVHLHIVPRYASERVWDHETFTDPHWGALFGREQNIISDGRLSRLNAELSAVLQE